MPIGLLGPDSGDLANGHQCDQEGEHEEGKAEIVRHH